LREQGQPQYNSYRRISAQPSSPTVKFAKQNQPSPQSRRKKFINAVLNAATQQYEDDKNSSLLQESLFRHSDKEEQLRHGEIMSIFPASNHFQNHQGNKSRQTTYSSLGGVGPKYPNGKAH
jgi:hypothetical protein